MSADIATPAQTAPKEEAAAPSAGGADSAAVRALPVQVATPSNPAVTAATPAALEEFAGAAPVVLPEDRGDALGLTRGDRRVLWGIGGLVVLLSILHWGRLSGWGLHEVEIDRLPERRFDFRVDINRATWVEWMQLEGIGELTARRIVEDRDTRGPFHSIDDVRRVQGIGPKTLAKVRGFLVCADCSGPASE